MRKGLDIFLTDSKSGKQKLLPRIGWTYELDFRNKDLSIDKSQYPILTRAKRDVQQGVKDFFLGSADYSFADVKGDLTQNRPIEHFFNRNAIEHALTTAAFADVVASKIRNNPGLDIVHFIDVLSGTRTKPYVSDRGILSDKRRQRQKSAYAQKGTPND